MPKKMDPNLKLAKEIRIAITSLEDNASKSSDGFARGKRAASTINRIKSLAAAMTVPGAPVTDTAS